MKRTVCSLAIFAVTSLLPAPPAESGERRFSVADVRGPFGFAWDGLVATPAGVAPAVAVGRFVADGAGNITDGVRTLVVAGAVLSQTFTCSYTVGPEGTGGATCTIETGGTPSVESIDFVIVDDRREGFFTGTDPGFTIRGVIKPQYGPRKGRIETSNGGAS